MESVLGRRRWVVGVSLVSQGWVAAEMWVRLEVGLVEKLAGGGGGGEREKEFCCTKSDELDEMSRPFYIAG